MLRKFFQLWRNDPKGLLEAISHRDSKHFSKKNGQHIEKYFYYREKMKENFKLLSKKAETNVRQAQHTW